MTKHLLLVLALFAPACAKSSSAPMPGDSVSADGAITLTPPSPVVAPGAAEKPAELGAIESKLFPAELVMEKQVELKLTVPQIDAIAKLAKDGQAAMLDLQWKLQAEKEKLVTLLSAEPVDEAKTMQRAAELMTYESRIKAAHLGMLVKIKNVLTPAQRATLQASRDPNRCAPADAGVH
jgi:hypothetical protein